MANCAIRHEQSGNLIVFNKSLKKEALGKYLKGFNQNASSAVIYQVTYGKNAMPAFESYLNLEQM